MGRKLDKETHTDLIDLLCDHLETDNERATLLEEAFHDAPRLRRRIQRDGSARDFTVKLVKEAIRYENIGEKHPLVILLETLKKEVGDNKQREIDKLIVDIQRQLVKTPSSSAPKESEQSDEDLSKPKRKNRWLLILVFVISVLAIFVALLILLNPRETFLGKLSAVVTPTIADNNAAIGVASTDIPTLPAPSPPPPTSPSSPTLITGLTPSPSCLNALAQCATIVAVVINGNVIKPYGEASIIEASAIRIDRIKFMISAGNADHVSAELGTEKKVSAYVFPITTDNRLLQELDEATAWNRLVPLRSGDHEVSITNEHNWTANADWHRFRVQIQYGQVPIGQTEIRLNVIGETDN
jgi:hypothetical protein